MKKYLSVLLSVLMLIAACFAFVACGDDEEHGGGTTQTRDDTKWFSSAELEARGLAELPVPTGLTGEMHTDITWFGDGYAFFQNCPDEKVFAQNAEMYFNMFKDKFDGAFGVARPYMLGDSETWYKIEQKNDLSDYFDDNPSKLYKFYYVKDKTTDEKGNFVKGAVWTFEMRYELNSDSDIYKLKIFIESADSTRNKMYTNYYKMA